MRFYSEWAATAPRPAGRGRPATALRPAASPAPRRRAAAVRVAASGGGGGDGTVVGPQCRIERIGCLRHIGGISARGHMGGQRPSRGRLLQPCAAAVQ